MLPSKGSYAAMLLGVLCYSAAANAQRHENHAAPTVLNRPDGVDQKDTLKDFHQALAVQATSQQIAEFQRLLKQTDSAKSENERLLQQEQSANSTSALDAALDTARTDTKNFTDGFSEIQKSGLKEQTHQLDRAEALLLDQQRKVDQALTSSTPPTDVPILVSDLAKAIEVYSSQQLALARAMGIVVANAQDVTFNLPAVKRRVTVANQPLQITVSSMLSETAADSGRRTFHMEMMGDLIDFEQNITEVLRGALNSDNTCGERLAVRRAVLMPSAPASNLHLQLHYERWACVSVAGQSSTTEIAENNGDVEIRLTPAASAGGLQVEADFVRVDAGGMMGDSLRTGDLGASLRDRVSQAFLVVMRSAADLKSVLPAALQGSATIKTARFEDAGAGNLALTLQGEAQLSDEQAKSLASQLNLTLSAQGNEIQ
jgi:hypothetical protein